MQSVTRRSFCQAAAAGAACVAVCPTALAAASVLENPDVLSCDGERSETKQKTESYYDTSGHLTTGPVRHCRFAEGMSADQHRPGEAPGWLPVGDGLSHILHKEHQVQLVERRGLSYAYAQKKTLLVADISVL